VRRRLAEQAGRWQEDFLGRQSGVVACEIRLPLPRGERQLHLSEDVYEVAAVDEDDDRIDDPVARIILLPDLETDGIHLGIIDPCLVSDGLDRALL
jgi:hypothetical protein